MSSDIAEEDFHPNDYQLVMDIDDQRADIPNLIYPFTIIMSICTISAVAYLSLSKFQNKIYLKIHYNFI